MGELKRAGKTFRLVWCVVVGWWGGEAGDISPLSRGRLILSLRYPQGSQSVVVSGRVRAKGRPVSRWLLTP